MHIIFKYLLKSIQEKKFRTFLVIISIVITTALFFASITISDTIKSMYSDNMKKDFGTAQIMVLPNEDSPSQYFNPKKSEACKDYTEYITGAIQSKGIYKPDKNNYVIMNINGYEYEELQQMNPVTLESQYNLMPFNGKKIIISQKTSSSYNIKAGDYIIIEINNAKQKFLVAGVAYPSGLFKETGSNTIGVIPQSTAKAITGAENNVSMIYIKLKDSAKKQYVMNELAKLYKDYTVKEPLTQEEIDQSINSVSGPFMLMVLVVFIMSVYIIYTVFRVITRERLPVIGTFRSIGATKLTSDIVMLAESITYGVIGGIIGCFAGVGVLYVMTDISTEAWMKVVLKFSPQQLILSFIMAVLLSTLSSLIPILSVSGIPIKEIVLNKIEIKESNGTKRYIIGAILFVLANIIPYFKVKNFSIVLDIASLIMLVAAIIMLIPFLVKIFIAVFEKAYQFLLGNEAVLAIKNLRDNKSMLNNISLLTIGISVILMINTVSSSTCQMLIDHYTKNTFEIEITKSKADKNFERSILSVAGVAGTYGVYKCFNVEIEGSASQITVEGVNSTKYLNYRKENLMGDKAALLNELNKGRGIIVTNYILERLNVKIGDSLTLKTKKGNRDYRIIGYMKSYTNMGSYALISERYIKSDMEQQYYNQVYVKTNQDADKVKAALRDKFLTEQPDITTISEIIKNEESYTKGIMNILKGFSVLAMLIGILGVLNNFMLSFIERRKGVAVLRSVGMSKYQVLKMMFVESFTGGIISGVVGLFMGIEIIRLVPYALESLNIAMIIYDSSDSYPYAVAAGILICVLASVTPTLKSSKLNIIEAIKYE